MPIFSETAPKFPQSKEEIDQEQFTKIPNKRKVGRHQPKHPVDTPANNSTNIFNILEGEPNENPSEGNIEKKEIETKQGIVEGADLPKRKKTKTYLGKEGNTKE